MPASGSQCWSCARATCGCRRLAGMVLTSMSTETPASFSRLTICSGEAVPCPNVRSIDWPPECLFASALSSFARSTRRRQARRAGPARRARREQMRGQVAGRTWIQRRMTDDQVVPQHAVEYVDQQVEVSVRAQIPVDLASLKQCPQRAPTLGGEFGEHSTAAAGSSGWRRRLFVRGYSVAGDLVATVASDQRGDL